MAAAKPSVINLERAIWLAITLALLASLAVVGSSRGPREDSSSRQQAYETDDEIYEWPVVEFISNLEVPWDLAFDESGQLFVTERAGKLKVFDQAGQLVDEDNLHVAHTGESGLTGLALHPNFKENGYIYLYYSYRSQGLIKNRVSRFRWLNGQLTDEAYIVDDLPGGSIHNGGRLRFGPDGKLWILTGDAARPTLAQDRRSLAGKVLRVNEDGSVPGDNPTPNSPIYSLGHRNPQGLAWHSLTEELLATEHGQTAHDEINIITPNGNYGWPLEQKCYADDPNLINPILCSENETWAPSGIAAYGTGIWRLRNSFFFTGLRGNLLERFELVEGEVRERETIIKGDYGRLRAVTIGPDGSIYVSTSNRDGRGNPTSSDDRILKITPKLKQW